jgi:uncharacterized protein YunC (DUF1805 family)
MSHVNVDVLNGLCHLTEDTFNDDYETIAQHLKDNVVFDLDKKTQIHVLCPEGGILEPQLGAECGSINDVMENGKKAIEFGVYAGIVQGLQGIKQMIDQQINKNISLAALMCGINKDGTKNSILVTYATGEWMDKNMSSLMKEL